MGSPPRSKRRIGFHMLELLIIALILAILVALSMPQFNVSKERALGKEANATLKLMAGAERIYRREAAVFFPYGTTISDINAINRNLSLSLLSLSWKYNITANATAFSIDAARNLTSGTYKDCIYNLTFDLGSASNPEDPMPSAECPE